MRRRRHRHNSDTETYQFGFGSDGGNAMHFGEPPYSLNRYEQSSNYASDVTAGLELRDGNYFWLRDDIFDFRGPYRI